MRTSITCTTLKHLWNSRPRTVPLLIMLTTAQLESGINENLYNATAERFEEKLFNRRHTPKWSEWMIFLGYSKLLASDAAARRLFTSYGLFQIMGFNLKDEFNNIVTRHLQACNGIGLEDYILAQMDAYESFMTPLVTKYSLREAFRRYNGSGVAAHAYADKAMHIHQSLAA